MDTADPGQQVRAALQAVIEPELGRPVTTLGFIGGVVVDGGRVHVRLRVPPFFRRTWYGWLVESDADAALRSLPWVEATDVCFGDGPVVPADDELSERMRDDVRRCAFLQRQYRLLRELLDRGLRRSELSRMRIGDLPPTAESAIHLRRRAELGLPVDDAAPVAVTEEGVPVRPDEMDDHVARLRAVAAAPSPDERW